MQPVRVHPFIAVAAAVASTSACVTAGQQSYRTMLREVEAAAPKPDDERALQAQTLERGALVRVVLSRNPSVESARQAWRAALARYRQAGTYADPTVRLALAPLTVASAHASVGYDVGISQMIPLGGKLDAQAQLAAAEAEVMSMDFHRVRLELALAASQLYDDYALAVRSLQIQAEHVALVQTLKQSAVVAYESGRASAQDSLQAESELAKLEYQQSVYESERDIAVAQLNALLHRDPKAPLPAPQRQDSPADTQEAPKPAADSGEQLAHRPDIAVARARTRVAKARSAMADSEFYPDIMVETAYSTMWAMPEHRWMIGVQLNIPLWRDKRHAAVEEAQAMQAESQNEVQSMTDAARGEVAVAERRVEQARRAVQLYEQRLVPLARDQIDAARSGFVSSQGGFRAVIEAERSLRATELELQMARADLSKRRAELDRVLGRIPELTPHEAVP